MISVGLASARPNYRMDGYTELVAQLSLCGYMYGQVLSHLIICCLVNIRLMTQ